MMPASKHQPTFVEALKFWLKLGFISFGGPAGQIAIMHTFLVEQQKWISEKKFLHALNYCMLLPGPEAQQMATYCGWLLHGIKGGITAGILFILPSVFILLGFSIIYIEFGTISWIAAIFNGLKPAVAAIVLLAVLKISKKALITPIHYGIAVISFISLFFLHIQFPIIIGCALVLGGIWAFFFPHYIQLKKTGTQLVEQEEEYFITSTSHLPHTQFEFRKLIFQVAVFIVLWCIPFSLFYYFSENFLFWKQLTLFFSKAALITFGGAYAVLPYVAQVSVENFNWLTQSQMIDGLALGETTPGPLIMVLAFVGFMAGFTQNDASIGMACLGLLVTTYYTFLPSFLFIFIGGPLIEKTKKNNQLKFILTLVSAAVVGVILNLGVYFTEIVLFPNGLSMPINIIQLVWIIISCIALHRFKIGLITWLGISAAFGIITFLFSK